MTPVRVLVLAGTTEATELAHALHGHGVDVTSSLAGVTTTPVARPGRVRSGGFGGTAGLAGYLRAEGIDAVVDATHPFAAVMPFHAAEASAQVGIPSCRLLRPGWAAAPGDRWLRVPDLDAAARALDPIGARRVLLAIGRQQLERFRPCTGQSFVVRSIEPPDVALPGMTSVLDRGPFDVAAERALLDQHGIDTVVAKDAGGSATEAKLHAARELGVAVVLVDRPPQPAGVEVVPDVAGALGWVRRVAARRSGG